MIALALLILTVETARNHGPTEAGLLLGLALAVALAGRWLLRDLRSHPANFPQGHAVVGLAAPKPRTP